LYFCEKNAHIDRLSRLHYELQQRAAFDIAQLGGNMPSVGKRGQTPSFESIS